MLLIHKKCLFLMVNGFEKVLNFGESGRLCYFAAIRGYSRENLGGRHIMYKRAIILLHAELSRPGCMFLLGISLVTSYLGGGHLL